MDLDLRDLELVDAVHRHGTLTAAATNLYVSQPALSQRLLRLERRLGAELFERTGRKLDPTTAGKRMIDAAGVALAELRDAVRDITQLGPQPPSPVRIATQCATNLQWIPSVLAELRRHDASYDVTITTVGDDEHADALMCDEIDVAIVHKLDRTMDRVRLDALFDDELIAVHATNHPWRHRRYVDTADFADVHLVLCDSYDPNRTPATPLPTPAHTPPARLTLLPLVTDMIIETVAGSDAVTIMPSWNAAPYVADGRVGCTRLGRRPHQRTWYAATRRQDADRRIAAVVATMQATLAAGVHTAGR
jgi:LysR family transcriptional regulator, regulator for metE and metH